MDMLVGDAAGLLERLGIASAHIYGVSMGGMVAQELALRYPELVSSLVLGATTCGGGHAAMPSQETLQKLFGIMTLSPDEAVKVSTSVTFSATFIERHPEKINEWLIKGAESPPSPMGFKRQAEAAAGFDTYDRLPQIRVPTLILAGTADQLIPSENSRILASRIPNAKLVLFEGAGHGYLWEAEEEANRTVHDFLRQHPKATENGSERQLTVKRHGQRWQRIDRRTSSLPSVRGASLQTWLRWRKKYSSNLTGRQGQEVRERTGRRRPFA